MYLLKSAVILYFLSLVYALPPESIYLQQGENFKSEQISPYPRLNIFCYKGKPKYLIHLWQSVVFQINCTKDCTHYEGLTPEQVKSDYESQNNVLWSFNFFTSKPNQIKMDPFNQSCVGLVSRYPYSVFLNVIRIDYWKVLLLVSGLFTFLSADKLSKNTVFHYVCGVTLGISASLLILIYLISKLFPNKIFMYGSVAFGWSVGIYFIQFLWENLRQEHYRTYVLWYTVITGIISFIFCYRWGPIENERSKNLMRWGLQFIGLLQIFFSTHFQEAAMGQIVLLLIFYNVPTHWLSKPKKYWKKRFPPKVKLLTNDEYYEQGVKETTKALQQLRDYCNSPECKQWKIAMNLKDVKRFASFVEGNSHLTDEEILEYETSIQETNITDDEDENVYTDDESY